MSHREIFSKNLNIKMKEAGKTRTDICDSLGFSYYTVTDWVKGKKMPRMDKLEKLAKYFGCLISDLIEENTEEQKKSRSVFAKNLKYYMEIKGISQKELAEIIGVSAPTLNEWIKAKKYPRIDKVERLANYFGCLKSDLIEEKTEEQKKNDTLSDIIQKLSADKELLDAVVKLSKLDAAKQIAVKNVIDAFSKVDN